MWTLQANPLVQTIGDVRLIRLICLNHVYQHTPKGITEKKGEDDLPKLGSAV